jgi:hypothetical protein
MSVLCPFKRQVRTEEKLGIQNKITLSKAQLFDVEFEVHLVSLRDAKSQPISLFLHTIGDRVRPPFCCLINNVRLIIPFVDMHGELLFTGGHSQVWTGGDQ